MTINDISKERLVSIIKSYVGNDYEAAEPGYVRETLEDVCGMDKKEAEALGLGYVFDGDTEEDDDYCEDDYTSASRGDYGPSCPWNAPGMKISDFI